MRSDRAVAPPEPFALDSIESGGFRLADGEGLGAVQPVVLRIPGTEPCVPLRLTSIASEPVLSVTAIFLADTVVAPSNFSDALLDPATDEAAACAVPPSRARMPFVLFPFVVAACLLGHRRLRRVR